MKWKDIFTLEKERDIICFTKSGHMYGYSNIDRMEVCLEKVQKKDSSEILNSLSNAMSGSFATGEELMRVHLRISMKDEEVEDILISEKIVNRFSDAYYEDIRVAKKIKERIKEFRE